jgi:multidrug efflux system outer membrane protein
MRRNRILGLTLVATALAAAGCTLEPHYTRPEAPVAASFPEGDAYRQPEADANAVDAASLGWREFFADPRLQRLIELALVNNRDLRVSALRVEEARAQFRIQRAALLPLLDAVGTGTRQRVPADLSPTGRAVIESDYQVGGSASWELDFFGRLRSLSNAALAQYFSTAQARKAAQLSLVAQVANQYLTMLAYDEQLKLTQETLRVANESLRITSLQFENGTGSELDVRQAQTVVEQAKANYSNQVRLRAQAENALVRLVGQALPDDLPPPQPFDDQGIIANVPAGLPSDLLTRRPDIISAEETLRSANANIGAARAAFFPSITLTGSIGTASSSLGGLFKAGSAVWAFAPDIRLPIFAAGQNMAALEAARAEQKIAVAQYEAAIQSAFRDVADGLAARGTYDDQIASLSRNVFANQRRLNLSELRYTNGIDSYLSVLTAQNDLYGSQQTLISTRLARLTNLVTLYTALGGGWVEHTGDQPLPADTPTTVAQAASAADAASGAAAQ